MAKNFIEPTAGLLIPVFAMRREGDFGIGDTKAVCEAIDFCARHGFRVLQTLPIHDTIGDHSPYNPISSIALSPALLTLAEGDVPGLDTTILSREADESWLANLREGIVKHRLVHSLKLKILFASFDSFIQQGDSQLKAEWQNFEKQESAWLPDYTLFRCLAAEYENNPHWEQWRREHQHPQSAEAWLLAHPENEKFQHYRSAMSFIQWVADRQWKMVRKHAEAKGIILMGEMSFGVSKSSVDVWAHPELFDTEWSMGTPPVVYFDTNKDSVRWGQNWGLPPYRWNNHRAEGFRWLKQRIQAETKYFQAFRLDHLRGYFRAYMFPWQGGAQHSEYNTLTDEEAFQKAGGRKPRYIPGSDQDQTTKQMNDLQGRELISVMQEAAGDTYLFAELMGKMPDYMRQALDDLELANLTFPLLEKTEDGQVRSPDQFRRLSLVSFGNHDHDSISSSYQHMLLKAGNGDERAKRDIIHLLDFAKWNEGAPETMTDELLASLQGELFKSPCILAVLSITDLLGVNQRFNLPGSYGDETWCERLEFPFAILEQHPIYGPRIRRAAELLKESGRK